MRLENSFTVSAPLEETWRTLLDIERVATCLPGAKIEPGGDNGVYRGAMKVKLGPMTVEYRGTATLQDVDEDTHTASIAVQAREAKGQGTAAAVIRNQLEPHDGGTRVVAVTELNITGRQAQFGRGIMEDVANGMMGQFATRLERLIEGGDEPAGNAAGAAPAADVSEPAGDRPGDPGPGDAGDALDFGNVLAQTSLARYGIPAGSLLALLVLVLLLRRRQRQFTVNLNLGR